MISRNSRPRLRWLLLFWGLIISSVGSAEGLVDAYNGLFNLHKASTLYYAAVKGGTPFSGSPERIGFDDALATAESDFSTPEVGLDVSMAAMNTIELLRESGEFLGNNGYTYPAGDEEMEASFEALRLAVAPLLPGDSAQALPYQTFDALSHAFHNYLAVQASAGGDIMNPVISKKNVSTLVQTADLLLAQLLDSNPENRDLKSTKVSWEFIKGPMMKWQETEIVFLVRRYQDKILQEVMAIMADAAS